MKANFNLTTRATLRVVKDRILVEFAVDLSISVLSDH